MVEKDTEEANEKSEIIRLLLVIFLMVLVSLSYFRYFQPL